MASPPSPPSSSSRPRIATRHCAIWPCASASDTTSTASGRKATATSASAASTSRMHRAWTATRTATPSSTPSSTRSSARPARATSAALPSGRSDPARHRQPRTAQARPPPHLRRGFHVVNIDATVIADRPRLAPHIDRMRESIAITLGLRQSRQREGDHERGPRRDRRRRGDRGAGRGVTRRGCTITISTRGGPGGGSALAAPTREDLRGAPRGWLQAIRDDIRPPAGCDPASHERSRCCSPTPACTR
jgi:hypothetical protein